MLDALEQDRQLRALPQEGDVGPLQALPGEDLEEHLAVLAPHVPPAQAEQRADGRRGDPDLRGGSDAAVGTPGDPGVDESPEHRVARVLRDAHAPDEGQVGAVEVARAPAELLRVERDLEGVHADRLGACDQALDEFVVGTPVQLVPERATAALGRDALHGNGGLGGEHGRDAEARGRASDRQVGVVVDEFEHADRRSQQGSGVAVTEQLDAEVAIPDVAQHAGHDPPVVERAGIRLGGGLQPRGAVNVGPGLGAHRAFGFRHQGIPAHRDARLASGDTGPVDRGLGRASGAECPVQIGRIGHRRPSGVMRPCKHARRPE